MSHRHADVASLRMLRKARDRIDRDYREEIGIEALARGAGYSREHFIRAFRAAYGETPGRYRTRRRVERARELLRSRYRAEAASRGGPAPIPGCFALMWETGLPAGNAAKTALPEKPPPRPVA